jgi:two-component system chemotaxis sensor kinase CheA
MSFSEQEIEEFKVEALELLEVAEKSLLSLNQGGAFQAAFDATFRSFHNLKGGAGIMDLARLQAHMHELETILMRFKGQSSMPERFISFFLLGIDASRTIIDGKEIEFQYTVGGEDPAAPAPTAQDAAPAVPAAAPAMPAAPPADKLRPDSGVGEFISESEEILDRVAAALRLIETDAYSKETLEALYRDVHSLKGTAYLFSFNRLGEVSHAIESSLETVREGSVRPGKSLLDALYKSLEVIEAILENIKNGSGDSSTEVSGALAELKRAAAADEGSAQGGARSTAEAKSPTVEQPSSAQKESESNGSIRVPVVLLDSLMTLMGEMVLVRNQVLQYSSASEDLEFLNLSKRLNVVTSEIQTEMMKTRMQPIGNVLNRFNRVVRDLSQELKKNINITLSGAETELDKSLLEAIKDPLTHIVRNSCDHGIETPAQRRQSGKPEAGTIVIRSYHEGGQVIIEVQDDGRGLHKDVLVAKAVEKGVITPAQAAKLTEKEIFNLIFAPGFSTAAAVTNVSGRGVGMDVVRSNIERIGGTVDLISSAGAGTTIKLKIPLTLAIVPALIVKCGRGTFAIPQVKLEELVRVDQESSGNKVESLHGAPVFRLRGNILPLVDLGQVLRVSEKRSYTRGIVNIAVVTAEHCSFGLIIDEVQDTADIVVKPLNRLLKSLHVYSGATILGNGSVALILDVPGISKVARVAQERRVAEAARNELRQSASNEAQDYLLVNLNSRTKHAIVLNYVHRLEEFKRTSIEYSGSVPVIRYRDIILPLVSVSEHLGYGPAKADSELVPVVVIQRAERFFGLVVEGIHDTLSTPTALITSLVKQPGIFGSLNTESELVVVIDPFELVARAFPEEREKADIIEAPLPAAVSTADPLSPFSQGNARRGGGKILLAEDTVFFRRAIKAVLEKTGYEVVTVNDGQEAIDRLSAGADGFDLIISDIEMPRVNGFQLASSVRKNPALSMIPLLAVSSRADRHYMQEGHLAGFDIYLEKLKPSMLVSAVEKLIQKKRSAA